MKRQKNKKTMTTTKFKGTPVHIDGEFIRAGAQAPDFELVKGDLSPLKLSDLKGKRVVLNMASSLPDTVVVAVSKDLPFAQSRFCTTEGIANVVPASDFRAAGFAGAYGVLMADGPLAGLLARAVVVIDKAGKVVYTQLVPEITEEPDYDAAVEAVKAF